jgi:hypothetical protein
MYRGHIGGAESLGLFCPVVTASVEDFVKASRNACDIKHELLLNGWFEP